jgi:hypothetical protein
MIYTAHLMMSPAVSHPDTRILAPPQGSISLSTVQARYPPDPHVGLTKPCVRSSLIWHSAKMARTRRP